MENGKSSRGTQSLGLGMERSESRGLWLEVHIWGPEGHREDFGKHERRVDLWCEGKSEQNWVTNTGENSAAAGMIQLRVDGGGNWWGRAGEEGKDRGTQRK